jgi:TRAP-type C4-dicarboxylate transport system permease small subunit
MPFRILDKSLAWLVGAGYAVMVMVGFAQVVFRYVLASPLSWSEELVRYVFVWSVFLTAAIAFNQNAHIVIDFLVGFYPSRLRRAARLVSSGCAFVAVAIVFGLGLQLILSPSIWFQKSPAMEIPMAIPYASIPVGSALMLVNIVRSTWRAWKGPSGPHAHVEVG